jgi:hypothetical protein
MWSVISEVQERIRIAMEGMKKSNIEFTSMVASELLENAIKYGVSNENLRQVGLDFELENNYIIIKVKNAVIQSERLDAFKEMMQKIITSQDKKKLYLERLKEIMDNPLQNGSRLGLYRIVSEGEFNLNFKLENDVLEMIAEKKLQEK